MTQFGHEVIVANARNVRLIGESRRKDDRLDARTLARLARIDPQLLVARDQLSGYAVNQDLAAFASQLDLTFQLCLLRT